MKYQIIGYHKIARYNFIETKAHTSIKALMLEIVEDLTHYYIFEPFKLEREDDNTYNLYKSSHLIGWYSTALDESDLKIFIDDLNELNNEAYEFKLVEVKK